MSKAKGAPLQNIEQHIFICNNNGPKLQHQVSGDISKPDGGSIHAYIRCSLKEEEEDGDSSTIHTSKDHACKFSEAN